MPSSEEVIEAYSEIERWYFNHLSSMNPDWSKRAITEVCSKTSHEEKVETFSKLTGTWTGVYSPY